MNEIGYKLALSDALEMMPACRSKDRLIVLREERLY
jgi:hypothetical protein